jgi:gluconokinase
VIRAIVVMGVSGCGKSTLGTALATALGWRFLEGDTLHPASNIAKMKAGIPLTDEDRGPFLRNVAGAINAALPASVVVSCSALKRSYRDVIREHTGAVTFVLPNVDRAHLLTRLERRRDHFMPATLIDSQLQALEQPGPDERALVLDGTASTDTQVAQVLDALRTGSLQ